MNLAHYFQVAQVFLRSKCPRQYANHTKNNRCFNPACSNGIDPPDPYFLADGICCICAMSVKTIQQTKYLEDKACCKKQKVAIKEAERAFDVLVIILYTCRGLPNFLPARYEMGYAFLHDTV